MKKKDKIASRIAMRMQDSGPHKLIKLEMQAYLKKVKQEEEEQDLFDIDKTEWKELE